LDEVEGVGVEIANEFGIRHDFVGVNAEAIGDDILDALKSGSQVNSSSNENCDMGPRVEKRPDQMIVPRTAHFRRIRTHASTKLRWVLQHTGEILHERGENA